jgi:hypothetical protein
MNAMNLKTVMTKPAMGSNRTLLTTADRIGQGLMVVTMPTANPLSQGQSLPQRPEPEPGSRHEEVFAMRYLATRCLPTAVTPIGSIGRFSGPHTRGDLFAALAAKQANRLLGTPPNGAPTIDAIGATPSWSDTWCARHDNDCQSFVALDSNVSNRGCKPAAIRSAVAPTTTSES